MHCITTGFPAPDYASYAAFFTEAARRFADMELREALDLGCGAGGLSAALAGMGLDVVGLDVSPEMLSVARAQAWERKRSAALSGYARV